MTGIHTGRSPNDKFFTREASTEEDIWWGDVNRPIDAERFASIEKTRDGAFYWQGCLRTGLLCRC